MSNPYQAPTLECDVVMKGGITSGVVYPQAICELAKVYRLRSVGGASAGAIAAVAAAAAEYGRGLDGTVPGAGFTGLEALPRQLAEPVGDRSRLLSLFQPAEATRGLFALLLALLEKPSGTDGAAPRRGSFSARKAFAVVSLLAKEEPGPFLAAVLLTLPLAVGAATTGGGWAWPGVIVAAVVLGVGALAAAAALAALRWSKALGPRERYGVCSGFAPPGATATPPLTTWLADLVDTLAGRPVTGEPLTLGDLRAQGIQVVTMTTNLTHGRPHRLPLDTHAFFFREAEFRELFPKRVVDFMVAKAGKPSADGLYPFPDEETLPLVVAARLSLSFPVLLQAVPLWAKDYGRGPEAPAEVCWFSDGGICSNLPIHFFDSLLPSRPTFALNLRAPHPSRPNDLVDLPANNREGLEEAWNRFDRDEGALPLGGFFSAMLDTMQSWNDNLTTKYPGYRDRVVHIALRPDEGGLNLNMPPPLITQLGKRGQQAGAELVAKFAAPARPNGWDNHLWVRYRVLLAGLTDAASALERADVRAAVLRLLAEPPSYALSEGQSAVAAQANGLLFELSRVLVAGPSLSDGAPKPRADLKPRPRSS